jgi:hypothetical protein
MFVATLGNTRGYRLRDSSLNLHEDEHFKSHNFLNPFKMSQGNCANFGHVNTNIANECRGYAVAQLVEALCYKPEGRGFGSRWSHWSFSLT